MVCRRVCSRAPFMANLPPLEAAVVRSAERVVKYVRAARVGRALGGSGECKHVVALVRRNGASNGLQRSVKPSVG